MDYNLLAALDAAWARIGPKLANDPTELAARKARRRLKCFTRPPRAWCLAVRASDHRMTPMYVAMVPDRPVVRDPRTDRIIHREHEVILDAPTLRWLCRPVAITWPGETVEEVASRLGVGTDSVRRAIKNTRAAESLHPTPPLEDRKRVRSNYLDSFLPSCLPSAHVPRPLRLPSTVSPSAADSSSITPGSSPPHQNLT